MRKYQLPSLFILIGLLAGACNQLPPNQQVSQMNAVPDSGAAPVVEGAAGPDPLDMGIIKDKLLLVHGADTLAFEDSTAKLVRCLGQPDKVDVNTIECGGHFDTPQSDPSLAQIHHYGASHFEVYGPRAVMRVISFQSGNFKVSLGGSMVGRTTTPRQFLQLYPQAALAGAGRREGDKTYWSTSLRPDNSDSSWTFVFVNGNLAQLEYYIPC